MAKQSGLHQIRGKVGEHSYYRQTGVSAGLIRSINQGLSSRVKTGAEYVNTRLNNDEFGQACRVASKLISYITPKYRPMILPFSQAKLAKDLLQLIKEDTASWGQRNISDANGSKVAPLVSALAKNNFEEYGLSLSIDNDALTLTTDAIISAEKLQSIGADGFDVRVVLTNTWIGNAFAGGGGYITTSAHEKIYTVPNVEANESYAVTTDDYPADPSLSALQSACKNVFVIVMPFRTINSVKNVLQEYCTFKALAEINIP